MIEFCCLAILLVVLIFLILLFIPKKHKNKDTKPIPKNVKKVDGKICIKCGNVSPLDSKFCSYCGNKF